MSRIPGPRRSAPVLVIALLLVFTGCRGPHVPEPPATPEAAATSASAMTPPEVVWTVDAVPWTEAEQVGDVVVVGLLVDRLPRLTGLDAATGEKLWSRPMSPSSVLRGIAMRFHVRDGIVAFLEGREEPDRMAATLTSVRASTGEVVGRTPAREFDSYPSRCDHDAERICVSADGVELQLSADRRSLSAVPSPEVPDLDWMQQIGPYGLVRYVMSGNSLGLASVDGTTVRWKVSERWLFGEGFSTNGGWAFEKLDEPKYLIGSVGAYSGPDVPKDRSVDRAGRSITVAIDARNGELVWRRDGVGIVCLDGADQDLEVIIACGETGTITFRDDKFQRWADPGRRLEAIDPRTGDLRWAVTWQPHARAIIDVFGEPARLTDTTLLARGPDPLVIDLTTGDTRPAGPTDIAWCEASAPQTTYAVGAPSGDTIWGTAGHEPCDGGTDEVDAMPSAIPEAVGLRVGDLSVVLREDRVTAYRV